MGKRTVHRIARSQLPRHHSQEGRSHRCLTMLNVAWVTSTLAFWSQDPGAERSSFLFYYYYFLNMQFLRCPPPFFNSTLDLESEYTTSRWQQLHGRHLPGSAGRGEEEGTLTIWASFPSAPGFGRRGEEAGWWNWHTGALGKQSPQCGFGSATGLSVLALKTHSKHNAE